MPRRTKRPTQIEKLCLEKPREVIAALFESPLRLDELETQISYMREGDDDRGGYVGVQIGIDGDVHTIVFSSELGPEQYGFSHRFRGYFGGGHSLRVRNALLMLALAIKIENEEDPKGGKQEPAPEQ
jgi:hypothetical protein